MENGDGVENGGGVRVTLYFYTAVCGPKGHGSGLNGGGVEISGDIIVCSIIKSWFSAA